MLLNFVFYPTITTPETTVSILNQCCCQQCSCFVGVAQAFSFSLACHEVYWQILDYVQSIFRHVVITLVFRSGATRLLGSTRF